MSTCSTTSTELLELIDEAMRLEVHMAASGKERPAGQILTDYNPLNVVINTLKDFKEAINILRARGCDVDGDEGWCVRCAWYHTTKNDHTYFCYMHLTCR